MRWRLHGFCLMNGCGLHMNCVLNCSMTWQRSAFAWQVMHGNFMVTFLPGRGVSVYLPSSMSIGACAEYLETRFAGLNVATWAFYCGHCWYVMDASRPSWRKQWKELDKKSLAMGHAPY